MLCSLNGRPAPDGEGGDLHIYGFRQAQACVQTPGCLTTISLSRGEVCCRDQLVYKQSLGADPGAPEAVTSKDGKQRFADGVVDEQRSRLVAVCEDHSGEGEAVNTISAIGECAVNRGAANLR